MDKNVRLSFLGAAGTVTGSRYLLESDDRRVLVDCGLFQGFKQLRLRNWAKAPVAAHTIDAVVLTHAHIDHSGMLPALTRDGFRGRIYCSEGTLELCKILLPDSAYLQEEDARFANRHGTSKHKPALPLYTVEDAKRCLKQLTAVSLDERFAPAQGFSALLRSAGHLLGSTFVRLETGGTSVTFSGDVGRSNDSILNPPAAPLPTDYLICESTYGDRKHPQVDSESELLEWLLPVIERRGVVVVPAFAVGRAQALLLHIARLKHQGRLPDVPVYLDSPMAIDASALYRRFAHEHRLSKEDCLRMCHAASAVNTPEQSKSLDQRGGPMIIVSASGMATGGRVIHHLKHFVGDPRNLVLLAGFQAPGTRGAALANGARTVRIHGDEFAVRSQVGQLRSSSTHADADELLAWMRRLGAAPRCTFITHGEPAASDALRFRVEHELGWDVSVPEYREEVDLY